MSLSHRLSDSLRRAFGEDAAEELVGWMDEVESRRMDAAEFRETVRGDIAGMRQEMRDASVALELKTAGRFTALEREIKGVETGMKLEVRDARHEVIKW